MVTPYHQNNIKNTQRVLILIIVWYLIMLTVLDAQPIPNEFFQFKSQKLLYDAGENWKSLTPIVIGVKDVSVFGVSARRDTGKLKIP